MTKRSSLMLEEEVDFWLVSYAVLQKKGGFIWGTGVNIGAGSR
jgi:hypothetical protein